MATVVATLSSIAGERGVITSAWTFTASGPGAVETGARYSGKSMQVNGLPTTGTSITWEGSSISPTGPFSNLQAVSGGDMAFTADGFAELSTLAQYIRPIADNVTSGTSIECRMVSVHPRA